MATSGTTTFNLDLTEIMEEAFDLCGVPMMSGGDFNTAKRALNLIFLEWQNKGLNLWKVEQASISLVAGTSSYAANTAALEIVDAYIRTDANDTEKQIDTKLRRISRVEYNHQAKKLNQAKPTQYYVDKGTSDINLVVWSTPDSAQTYTLFYDYIKRIENLDTGEKINYKIVGKDEADLKEKLIYFKSPISKGLIGKIKGDYVEINTPAGKKNFEVKDVRYI